MDNWFIAAIIFFSLTCVLLIIATLASSEVPNDRTMSTKKAFTILSTIPLFIAVVCTTIASVATISTNHVGIFTEAGRPYAITENGFQTKRPWSKVTELDGSRQFLRFCGKGNDESDPDKKLYPEIATKIDGNAKATICGVVGWQMLVKSESDKSRALMLFKDFKAFNRITDNHVYPAVKEAIHKVMKDHNPLMPDKNLSIALINERVMVELKAALGDSLVVMSSDISVPDYDEVTDRAIAEDLAQKAKTLLAVEKQKTNAAEAIANNQIVKSIQDATVLINKCLDFSKEMGYAPGLCMMSGNSGILPSDAFTKK